LRAHFARGTAIEPSPTTRALGCSASPPSSPPVTGAPRLARSASQRYAASGLASTESPDRLDRELSSALAAGLRRLSRRDREALLLLAWGELTYAEIGYALDVPVGTVRSRIHHARQQLTKHLPLGPSTLGEAHA
jgi:RNA polymerase sigma factor (sigma-70 family)